MKHTAKKILCTLLVMVMCLTVAPLSGFVDFGITASALADSGSCGENVTYTYDSSTGELVISGTGAMTNYIRSYSGNDDSPFYNSDIKSVVIEDGVTSIGNSVFLECRSLASVTIPDSVTTIGDSAFYDCTSLASVTIPDSVTSIEDCAFLNCRSLASIIIPDSVTSIGVGVFEYCTSLENVTIPDSVASIGVQAFLCCENLASVTIPDSVTFIGVRAFYYCTNLTSVTIGDSVTTISDSAFYWCESLQSVTIGDSVTSIDSYAFYDCTSLTDVYYGGTEEQWNSINIDEVGNECLTGATIHFHTHSYTSTVTKAASCTEAGVRTYTCSCGDSYTEAIPATGHADNNGDELCDACGEDLSPEEEVDNSIFGKIEAFFMRIIEWFRNLFR